MLTDDFAKMGVNYEFNDDATYTCVYNGVSFIFKEDCCSYFLDLRTGLGWSEYSRDVWSLEEAIRNEFRGYCNG